MDSKEKITVMWFVYEWNDKFTYFPTQAEAISYLNSRIPFYLDYESRDWVDTVECMSVGCFTHKTIKIPREDREYCDWEVVPVLD